MFFVSSKLVHNIYSAHNSIFFFKLIEISGTSILFLVNNDNNHMMLNIILQSSDIWNPFINDRFDWYVGGSKSFGNRVTPCFPNPIFWWLFLSEVFCQYASLFLFTVKKSIQQKDGIIAWTFPCVDFIRFSSEFILRAYQSTKKVFWRRNKVHEWWCMKNVEKQYSRLWEILRFRILEIPEILSKFRQRRPFKPV